MTANRSSATEAALAVLREARELGRVVHLNSPNPRPYGEMTVIAEWLDAGLLGQPTLAHASTWCYYGATPADGSWYDDPQQCPAAPLFRLGIYPLNNLLTIFHHPVSVQVTHSRVETLRPTPDNASATIKFTDGAIVTLSASFVVGGPEVYRNSLTIAGTRGVIYYNTRAKPRDGSPEVSLQLSTGERLEERCITAHAGDYDWPFFAQRVRGEATEDSTTPEQIAAAIRVMEGISQAELSGETVSIA